MFYIFRDFYFTIQQYMQTEAGKFIYSVIFGNIRQLIQIYVCLNHIDISSILGKSNVKLLKILANQFEV